ncbi:MAG: hypothetical protein CMF71_07405 [Magnetovibrio sp.]|nr:hypothetical protein [Magnetovibrio sp.]
MNLYILDRTVLADLSKFGNSPKSGDTVIYFRKAQDPQTIESKKLISMGIDVIQTTDLLDKACVKEFDSLGAKFIRTWFLSNGKDISLIGDLSLGKSYAYEIARQSNPRQQIWYGEIFRRIITAYPEIKYIFSDIQDGGGVFNLSPASMPLRLLTSSVAKSLDCSINYVSYPQVIPFSFSRPKRYSWTKLIRGWISGLRPAHLFTRLKTIRKARESKNAGKIIYIFVGRGLSILGELLANRKKFHVITSFLGIKGAGYIRYDHLFVLPKVSDILVVIRLLSHLKRLVAGKNLDAGSATLNKINYTPHLARSTLNVIQNEIFPFLFVIAQTRKLQKTSNFDALLLNGMGNEPMGNLAMLTQKTNHKVYLSTHGLNIHRSVVYGPLVDNAHVTHLTHGTDHIGDRRTHDLNTPLLIEKSVGNTLTTLMNDIRGKHVSTSKKRLLVLCFGHLDAWRADRIFSCDKYYIDLYEIFKTLIPEGWTISLRGHPGHPHEMEKMIAKSFSLETKILWDKHSTLNDALLAHDCVVSNLTSAFYQSLYAGWPTIFYEPTPLGDLGPEDIADNPVLFGLPVAKDLERPVTNKPDQLLCMIRETLDPKSMVSCFPKLFSNELAPRFIGPEPANSEVLLADFLEDNFFTKDNFFRN